MRRLVLLTHRWMGLPAAVVLLVVGLSGAVLVWPAAFGDAGDGLTRLHTRMLIGEPGEWMVITTTVLSALLVLGGLILWWKRKRIAVAMRRGWWRFLFDLHHSVGLLAAVLMLLISLTGVALVLTEHEDGSPYSEAEQVRRDAIERLHTGREFAAAVQILYAVGSLAFVLQGISGFTMWWRTGSAEARVARGESPAGNRS